MTLNWGTGIAAAYLTFALATSGFVAFAMRRPVLLVRSDYYADSLKEDQHLAARRNALSLGRAAGVTTNGRDGIHISIPPDQAVDARGAVTLYRASDPAADRTIEMAVDRTGEQDLHVGEVVRGAWLVQVCWSAGGREYDIEQPIVLK